ncbi:uncharacterized protein LOC135479733 [Liolophura sinensis]|uniref:uncharacterized protein LOC135479733 n=1 Tax=Liolophura sinensis TaxID=3198878 RepID=UPI003158B834
MADCFLPEDATKLLRNKYVVFIGSSVMRSMYKDFVKLLQKNVWLSDFELRKKGENSFQGDELLAGGIKMNMSNGIQYREVRQYRTDHVLVRFYFITRCYNNYVESVFKELQNEPKPDLILLNSGLWDLTRYGANPVPAFKKNLNTAFTRLTEVVPNDCLLLWITCMPISQTAKGGVFVPEVEHLKSLVPLELLQANAFSSELARSFGFDVLDLCFFFRNQLHRIADDGIHWDMTAHRRFTNLILSHVSEAWEIPLPGRAVEMETPKDVKRLSAPLTSENGQIAGRKIKTVVRRRKPQNQKSEKDEDESDEGDKDDESGKPEKAGDAVKVGNTDKPHKCDESEKDKSDKADAEEKFERVDQASKDEKSRKDENASKDAKVKKANKTDRFGKVDKASSSMTHGRSKTMQNKSPVRFFRFEYRPDHKDRLLTSEPRKANRTEHAHFVQSCKKLDKGPYTGKSIVDDVSEALHTGSGFAVHSRQHNRRQRQHSAHTPRTGAFSVVGKGSKIPTATDLRGHIHGRSSGYIPDLTMDSEDGEVHKNRLVWIEDYNRRKTVWSKSVIIDVRKIGETITHTLKSKLMRIEAVL